MFTDKKEIVYWLHNMNIKEYIIHDDLTVDVKEAVDLYNKNILALPIQFGIIDGAFDCSKNNLTSLKGSPHTVKGNFFCDNNQLNTLDFCPKKVNGKFDCSFNLLQILHPLELACGFFYHGIAELYETITLFHKYYQAKFISSSIGIRYHVRIEGEAFLEEMQKLTIENEKNYLENCLNHLVKYLKKDKI